MQEERDDHGPRHYILTLPEGREIHVTDSEGLWRRLAEEGAIVFSENELKRFQTACSRMDSQQRAEAIQAIIDTKETFTGAYIKRGREIACIQEE